jgi:hypothetical protein
MNGSEVKEERRVMTDRGSLVSKSCERLIRS